MYGLCEIVWQRTTMNLYLLLVLFYQQIEPAAKVLQNFFVPILNPFTINEYTNKNSFHFSDQDQTLIIAYFDIHSLFINMP